MSKRKNKRTANKPVPVKKKIRNYPVMFCLKEQKIIAFSLSTIPFKSDRFGKVSLKRKVCIADWSERDTNWLEEYYKDDMSKYSDGDMVFCKHCNNPVDFRIFPSKDVPRRINKIMEKESKPLHKRK